jgi:hypothetical protein
VHGVFRDAAIAAGGRVAVDASLRRHLALPERGTL